jgi:hypothetical protein
MKRNQFQGIESWRLTGSVGPVGDLVQAAAVPMSRAMSRRRKMFWRVTGRLRERVADMVTTGGRVMLTRYVTNYHAM